MHHVVVAEGRRDTSLIEEHRNDVVALEELLAQALDHELLGEALDARILGTIDLGHASGGDVLDQDVLVSKGSGLDVAQVAMSLNHRRAW